MIVSEMFIIPVKENAGNESKYVTSGKQLAYSIHKSFYNITIDKYMF